MERGEEREGMSVEWIAAAFSYHVTYICTCILNIYTNALVLCLFNFSLGCGIGYGYLHRIPTRPAQPNTQNKRAMQSTVIDSNKELVASDHTEVEIITSLCSLVETLFFSSSKTHVLCSQVPSVESCSPSSASEIDVNQTGEAMQDLCVPSPTQPPVDLGNQISFLEAFICLQRLM